MKSLLATTAAIICLCGAAEANQITRHVPSGKTTTIMMYKPRNQSCENAHGTVTLVSKPQHGTVAHHVEPTTHDTGFRSAHCYGKPTLGFAVTYTPAPGFRGVDHFIIEVRALAVGLHRLDGFAIIVK
jgi:hypothetical protein